MRSNICGGTINFNPLPPHGGRLQVLNFFQGAKRFQSTPSAWRETEQRGKKLCRVLFQSTPSAWRETHYRRRRCRCASNFNPLPPHGGRPSVRKIIFRRCHFNPLPPHGGRLCLQATPRPCQAFQSTPSAWRETAKLHRKAFFISPILVQSCKKGCKRLHSAPEKMVFFEKREKNLVRNLQHLSVRL